MIDLGVEIHFADAVKNIPSSFLDKEKTLVVYTPAIPKTHLEFNYFKDRSFEILKRAEILGKITEHTFCLAVAGTHGKTTTSSILGHIMQPTQATSFLGGIMRHFRGKTSWNWRPYRTGGTNGTASLAVSGNGSQNCE